jgi:hypothetical protein
LGALKKEREEEIKERGQMSHYEKKKIRRERRKISIEQPKFSPKSSSFQERYEKKKFLKGAKYSPSLFLHPYITTPNPYHLLFTTCHLAYTHAYLDLIV